MFFLFFVYFFLFFIILIPILISVAFLTLLERKVRASIQRRRGPNIVGFFGLFQPIADGIKLRFKETVIPYRSKLFLFFFSPILSFTLSLLTWILRPLSNTNIILDLNLGVLYLFRISSLNVYGIIMAGWSSSSKYTLLGSLRSSAQRISYEVSLGFTLLPIILWAGSLSFLDIISSQLLVWNIITLFPIFIIFLISILAETNRVPFDLPEAESELVSGFNTEYSSRIFAFFFLAEYSNIILNSFFLVILFLGGDFFFFNFFLFRIIKVFVFIYFFLWVRASFPRYRFDQLRRMGWKNLLPFSLSFFIFLSTFLFCLFVYV